MSAREAAGALPMRAELTRKGLHLATAGLPLAWWGGLVTAATVRALLVAAAATALLVELLRRVAPPVRRRFDAWFGGLLRPHEAHALTGSTWLALAMLAVVLVLPTPAALTALWAAAVGDGLASVVGRLVTRDATRKSWAGSLACLGATAVGAWWLGGASLPGAAVIGAAAAAAERPRLALDDNVRVTLAAGLAAWAILGR